MVGVVASSSSAALATQVSVPVLVVSVALMLTLIVGAVLSTPTEVLATLVSPMSSVIVTVQVTCAPGVMVCGVSVSVSVPVDRVVPESVVQV